VNAPAARDLARTSFAVLVLGTLVGASLWILWPFVGPLLWATMIVVSTWPLLLLLQRRLWGRRWAAVLVMTLALLLLFVLPLVMAIITIVGNADRLVDWVRLATTYRLPAAPPPWMPELPLVGQRLAQLWQDVANLGLSDLLPRLTPYVGDLTRWFVAEVGNVGLLAFQFLLTLGIAAYLFAVGEQAAAQVQRFARRLAGERGVGAVQLAGAAIRGVALGVGVTAVLQALLGGLGLAVAGVPFAGLLTALMVMLCIAAIGPLPVLVPAGLWVLFGQGDIGWGIFLLAWAAFVGTVDNFIRPVLIRLGADMSLLLILAGVLGGLFAFGLVGIFVGPVVLAVAWTLLDAWMADGDPQPVLPPEEAPMPPAAGEGGGDLHVHVNAPVAVAVAAVPAAPAAGAPARADLDAPRPPTDAPAPGAH
jgi:predicted PurR-regulated permease PerM